MYFNSEAFFKNSEQSLGAKAEIIAMGIYVNKSPRTEQNRRESVSVKNSQLCKPSKGS